MSDVRHKFRPPKGTKDLFESELLQQEKMEALFFETARSFGFQRIETPTFEHFEVFDSTSRLNREKCYNFNDKAGRELVLRSDINAPITRALVNNISMLPMPAKFFSSGNVYRYRHYISREFRMCGIESYGMLGFEAEVEVLMVMHEFLRKLGLDGCRIEFGNLQIYSEYLKDVVRRNSLDIDQNDMLHRLSLSHNEQETSEILGVLPQEEAAMFYQLLYFRGGLSESINLLDSFPEKSLVLREQFQKSIDFDQVLALHGLVNRKFDLTNLHGMGFYTGLTYRIYSDIIGKNIADGGRYDSFVAKLGGKEIPATGLGFGLPRLIELATSHGSFRVEKPKGVLVMASEDVPVLELENLLRIFRSKGWIAELETVKRKFPQRINYAKLKGYCGVVYLTHSKQSEAWRIEFFDGNRVSVVFQENNSLNAFENYLEELQI